MKFLVFATFLIASASGRGSGPYLPSGWRPRGLAFFLPSEVQKPSENPVDVILNSSEPAGSEAFKEYGPPKIQELPQVVLSQGLPDVEFGHNFIEVVPIDKVKVKEIVVEEKQVVGNEEVKDVANLGIEQNVAEEQEVEGITSKTSETSGDVTENSQDSVTESLVFEEKSFAIDVTTQVTAEDITERSINDNTVEAEVNINETEDIITTETARIADIALVDNVPSELYTITEATTSSLQAEQEVPATNVIENESFGNDSKELVSTNEQTADSSDSLTITHADIQNDVSNIELKVEAVEQSDEKEAKKLEEVIESIPQVLINLDGKEQNVQVLNQETVDASILEASGTVDQAPEGFLEYGPPGFSEYGPPKGDQLAREAAEGRSLTLEPVTSNEARRRRFSPKFKPFEKHN